METHAAAKVASTKIQPARQSLIRTLSVLAMLVIAPDLQGAAVGYLEGFSGSPFYIGTFSEAGPHGNNLAHIVDEVLPLDPAALQIGHGYGLEGPGIDLVIGIFEIHIEIDVRILPIHVRERACHVAALRFIVFNRKGVMRESRRGDTQSKNER
jgi:hypothetical protein